MATSFFGGSFFGGEFFNTPATPTPTPPTVGGGRARKRERFAAKIDGKLQFFDSIEEIEGYLASLSEEKLEKVETRVKAYAGVAVRTGTLPSKPKIHVSRASGEVLQAVNRVNEMMAAEYMRIMLELRQSEDDEDDLLLL